MSSRRRGVSAASRRSRCMRVFRTLSDSTSDLLTVKLRFGVSCHVFYGLTFVEMFIKTQHRREFCLRLPSLLYCHCRRCRRVYRKRDFCFRPVVVLPCSCELCFCCGLVLVYRSETPSRSLRSWQHVLAAGRTRGQLGTLKETF